MKRDTLAIVVWTVLLAVSLAALTGIVALLVLAATWIFDRLPAAAAWLDADPLRPVALGYWCAGAGRAGAGGMEQMTTWHGAPPSQRS